MLSLLSAMAKHFGQIKSIIDEGVNKSKKMKKEIDQILDRGLVKFRFCEEREHHEFRWA